MTVQQVYDMAVHLLDEQNEGNGETVTVDTQEYKYRTISILNTVIPAVYPYSDTYDTGGGGRPSPPLLDTGANYKNPNFGQDIGLDETICAAVLPLYLAAQLIIVENDALAQWLMGRYQVALADVKSKIPGTFEPIATPYGLF